MSKLFQIYDVDLEALEQLLPEIADAVEIGDRYNPAMKIKLRRVKEILSNVRWDYGPPVEVERVDP